MPRKIEPEDFTRIRLVSDPQAAPKGAAVACVVTGIDTEKNKYLSGIWVVPAGGGDPRRFTGGLDWNDSCPRWSPDGSRIAFISDRHKPKSQIYVIPSDGGEAQPLTDLDEEGSITSLAWSPDGARIAFLFRATPDGYRKEQVDERQKKEMPSPVRRHVRLFYRLDGFGYFDDSFSQVWVVDAATGAAKQLTTGAFECGPPVWSPDSRTIAFISDRRDDRDILPPHDEIWTVPADGGALTRVASPVGTKASLSWSPDGAFFAYAGNQDPEDQWGTNNDRVLVLPISGGDTARDLTGHTDMTVGYDTLADVHDVGAGQAVQWSADGKRLYFPVSAFGDTRLYSVESGGGAPMALTPERAEMGGFSIAPGTGALAVNMGTAITPHEVFTGSVAGAGGVAELKQRTSFNAQWLADAMVLPPETVSIPRADGGTVAGWLLRPADSDAGQKHPLVLYVHGGPHLQYGNTFFHELQLLAAEGYVVLYTNPRGSKGYGEAHTKAIKGDWGGADFQDIMAAAGYAESLPFVDEKRSAIMGGSYGGYMSAWAVGHTDRFTCAVTDRLVANLHSMSGTTDFAWRHASYFKGNAWDDPSDLWRCSPLAHAGKINTPLLIIHSDSDLRCDIGQAEELFAALRLQGNAVEFVRYPAETSHGLSRNGPPNLRLDRLQRNLAWLKKWLRD